MANEDNELSPAMRCNQSPPCSTVSEYLAEIDVGTRGANINDKLHAWCGEEQRYRNSNRRITALRMLMGREMQRLYDEADPVHKQRTSTKVSIAAQYGLKRRMGEVYKAAFNVVKDAPSLPVEVLDYPLRQIPSRAALYLSTGAFEEAAATTPSKVKGTSHAKGGRGKSGSGTNTSKPPRASKVVNPRSAILSEGIMKVTDWAKVSEPGEGWAVAKLLALAVAIHESWSELDPARVVALELTFQRDVSGAVSRLLGGVEVRDAT